MHSRLLVAVGAFDWYSLVPHAFTLSVALLQKLNVAFPSPHRDHSVVFGNVKSALCEHLAELEGIDPDELVEQRRAKFRALGASAGRFPTVS